MHALTVHTKYELAPPYPSFAPKVFLKLDGVVVINTGDSLVALSIQVEDNHGGSCGGEFGLYSPLHVSRSVSSVSSSASSVISTDEHLSGIGGGECSQDKLYDEDPASLDLMMAASVLFQAQSPPCHRNLPPTPKDATNTSSSHVASGGSGASEHRLRDRHISTGKENQLNKQIGSPPPTSDSSGGAAAIRHDNRLHRSPIDVYNFEGGTPKKDDETSGDCADTSHDPASTGGASTMTVRPVRTTLSFSGYQQGARMQTGAEDVDGLIESAHTLDDLERKVDVFEKPNLIPRLQLQLRSDGLPVNIFSVISQRSSGPPSHVVAPADLLLFGSSRGGLSLSPGYHHGGTGSSTCSSCISSPIILQNESQCFTYALRRYIDSVEVAYQEAAADIEGRQFLGFHLILVSAVFK